jgi:hypothetical protein
MIDQREVQDNSGTKLFCLDECSEFGWDSHTPIRAGKEHLEQDLDVPRRGKSVLRAVIYLEADMPADVSADGFSSLTLFSIDCVPCCVLRRLVFVCDCYRLVFHADDTARGAKANLGKRLLDRSCTPAGKRWL